MNDTTDIDRQLRKEATASGGATVRIEDGRVSKIRDWVYGVIGAGIIGVGLLAANNLYQLNIAVNNLTTNNAAVSAQLADHEARLRQVERDVNTIAGRNMRGVVQEPSRGR